MEKKSQPNFTYITFYIHLHLLALHVMTSVSRILVNKEFGIL